MKIPINIWDDYDNGETFMMVESDVKYTDESKEILSSLADYLQPIKFYNVKFKLILYNPKEVYPNWESTGTSDDLWKSYWRINIFNLPHDKRELLIRKLNSDLLLNDSFYFYSES